MLRLLECIRINYARAIEFIEKQSNIIPFSRYLLIYLKTPFFVRLLTTLMLFGFTYGLSYIIGFIILQSKAKNEVLSLITAYHNPIIFSDILYLYYAFVYFCILVPTICLTAAYLFGGLILISKFKTMGMKVRVANYLVAPFWYTFGVFVTWGLLKLLPFIPFFLFYSSKNSSLWELLIKYLFMHEELPWFTPSLDYDTFQREVFISLQSGNMLIVLLIFFYIMYKRYFINIENGHKKLKIAAEFDMSFAMYDNFMPRIIVARSVLIHLKTKSAFSTVLYAGLRMLLLFVFLILFVIHTAYQLGSFGKNLAQFDTDYVTVEYQFNDNIQKVEGFRVYADKNYLIIRDNHNTLHSIVADQIHVQTQQPPSD